MKRKKNIYTKKYLKKLQKEINYHNLAIRRWKENGEKTCPECLGQMKNDPDRWISSECVDCEWSPQSANRMIRITYNVISLIKEKMKK